MGNMVRKKAVFLFCYLLQEAGRLIQFYKSSLACYMAGVRGERKDTGLWHGEGSLQSMREALVQAIVPLGQEVNQTTPAPQNVHGRLPWRSKRHKDVGMSRVWIVVVRA